ncbi:uncharacterized protein LAESUDRAFT_738637 [Laetiporus sulphureus 93-53]|uniref:OAR domain-containing protein n=1 Tax=Laetiporus sulphureus 93-53 TaxID=1314785 RepID=A0A165CBX7_9APHY|nr:uncharacterized protein LAESUDRAFT_738637 [Laetiporus sulphureus 93-53]KZT02534.1 hypothetical protein LAESUDRAFT_738637 [Laetiporus sulphureus 93-53]
MHYTVPIIDEQNPLYCPNIDAAAFLESLRQHIRSDPPPYSRLPEEHIPSFAERLDQSLDESDIYRLLYRALPHVSKLSSNSSVSSSIRHWEQETPLPRAGRDQYARSPPGVKVKRKRSESMETFSDLLAPPKRERSLQSVNDKSFEVSGKADRLCYFREADGGWYSPFEPPASQPEGPLTTSEMEHRICALEDELYGPPVGTESPRGISGLISRLDAMLPGMRLKERLYALEALTHQRIADMLAIDGHLNARVLNMLRMSEIECLDLTASLMDEEGLNMGGRELLRVFAKPNSFLFLSQVSLSGAALQDSDIINIHHLPRLSQLWLSNTGIGNEAIFHLVALKRTLTELDLALNPLIDDDAIPPLLALPKLQFLSVFDTGVGMPGLRRLAVAVLERENQKTMDIEACAELSTAALRRNLSEHAAFNAQILVGGSQAEMAERLQRILRMREMDLAARDLVWTSLDHGHIDEKPTEEQVRNYIQTRRRVTIKGGQDHHTELQRVAMCCCVASSRRTQLVMPGNILILRGQIEILPPERTTVSYDFLAHLVGDYLLSSRPDEDVSSALSVMPATRSTSFATRLLKLSEGMDLNPLFTGATAFRPGGAGGELKLFEYAGIQLVHGWLVDPDSPEAKILEKTEDYDTSINLLVEADHLTKGQLLATEENTGSSEAGVTGVYDTLTSEQRHKIQDGIIIRDFLDKTQSQLTYYGLFTLASTITPGKLVALFRNSHLSVLYKPIGEDTGLYTLVTDQVFLHESSVVWERLEDVEGGSSSFVDSDFVRSSPAGGDYAGHTAESALRAIEAQTNAMSLEQSDDLALARQLQAEEDEHAREVYARRQRERAQRGEQPQTLAAQHPPSPASTADKRSRKRKLKKDDCIVM